MEELKLIHYYLKVLKYPFATGTNIKKYLNIEGIPKEITSAQEMSILEHLLSQTRELTDIFEFLLLKYDSGYLRAKNIKIPLLEEKQRSILAKLQNLGCFGLNRYSGNFDINKFLGNQCTDKMRNSVLILLCKLTVAKNLQQK